MASTTTNLGLKLFGSSSADKETLFEDWRLAMNGEMDNSNMQIIDRSYKDMSDDIDELEEDTVPITNSAIDSMVSGIFSS